MPTSLRATGLAALALALAACGGSGNSPDPVPQQQQLQARADMFAAVTGTELVLDVLANDADPAGGLALVSIATTNPNVRIDGTRIRYLAPCCATTSEQFSYTVRSAAGRVANADVTVTIERRLTLTASAFQLAGATAASVQVGAAAPVDVPFDATQGRATFAVDFRDEDALVVVRMRRTAAVELTSVLGSALDIARAATASAAVAPAAYPQLHVSPLTTSLAGTIAAQAGALPTRGTDWAGRIAAFGDWDGVTRRAQYVATFSALTENALPAGQTLFALAADPVALDATIAAGAGLFARDTLFPADTFGNVAFGGPMAITYWFFNGGATLDDTALRLDFVPDGTGVLTGASGRKPFRWTNTPGGTRVVSDPVDAGSPALFSARLRARRGGVCGLDPLAAWISSIFPDELALGALSSTNFGGRLVESVVARATGTGLSGFSPSGCSPLFFAFTATPEFSFDYEAAARPVRAAMPARATGRWLLPHPAEGHVIADLATPSDGTIPGGGPVRVDALEDGSLNMTFGGVGTTGAYAVARYATAARVVAETNHVDGRRRVAEAWVAPLGAPPPLAARLRNVRLTGCCRSGSVYPLVFDADGRASFDDRGVLTPADVVVESSGAIRVRVRVFTSTRDLVITPLVEIDARRYLTFATLDGELPGSAQVLTIVPR